MIRALDSAAPPTAAQVAQAKAAGFGAWLGYLGKAGDNLLHPWTQADFQTVTAGGLLTGAYCSGQDDPAWVRATAAAWGLHVVILDDEAGIKADGTWVSGWLTAAGAGLYGGGAVMREWANNPAVRFCVLAAYPGTGNQTATWSQAEAGIPAPGKPHGWQWAGTVQMFGDTVDLANFDDAIFTTPQPHEEEPVLIIDTPSEGIFLLSGSAYVHIMDPNTVNNLVNAGVKQVAVDEGTHQNLAAAHAPSSPQAASPQASGTLSGTITIS